jgi:hypothetical protein
MTKRVNFCGAIGGSVVVRPGETEEQAIARAQELLLALMDRGAKRLGYPGTDAGPNVGLEPDPTQYPD